MCELGLGTPVASHAEAGKVSPNSLRQLRVTLP